MAFESLSEKLQGVFKNLRSKGRLTEDDVKAAMREVKRALLEADVNFKVVKTFIKSVQERAVGQDVLNGLNPGQMVIKIVKEEMEALMGSTMTEIQLRPGNEITIILMAGLQGAGKTTTCAKLAGQYKKKGKRPLLVDFLQIKIINDLGYCSLHLFIRHSEILKSKCDLMPYGIHYHLG